LSLAFAVTATADPGPSRPRLAPSIETPPTVSMTAPAAGATVSGSAVAVTAKRERQRRVVGVQFKLDGATLGAEDTTFTILRLLEYDDRANGQPFADGGGAGRGRQRHDAGAITVTVSNVVPDTTPPSSR